MHRFEVDKLRDIVCCTNTLRYLCSRGLYCYKKGFCMFKLLNYKLLCWFVVAILIATENAWSQNADTELIDAVDKLNFSRVKTILETKQFEKEQLDHAFQIAVKRGSVEITEYIMQLGVAIDSRIDDNNTPLLQAARDGREQIVQMLLAAGADVNAVSDDGSTALILAAEKDRRRVIDLLLAAQVDVNARRNDGMTALLLAAQEGHKQTIQTLIDANADVNYQLENGATALMMAAQHGNLGAVYALVAAKANLNLKANNGVTALILANQYRHREISELLKKAGAR